MGTCPKLLSKLLMDYSAGSRTGIEADVHFEQPKKSQMKRRFASILYVLHVPDRFSRRNLWDFGLRSFCSDRVSVDLSGRLQWWRQLESHH